MPPPARAVRLPRPLAASKVFCVAGVRGREGKALVVALAHHRTRARVTCLDGALLLSACTAQRKGELSTHRRQPSPLLSHARGLPMSLWP